MADNREFPRQLTFSSDNGRDQEFIEAVVRTTLSQLDMVCDEQTEFTDTSVIFHNPRFRDT